MMSQSTMLVPNKQFVSKSNILNLLLLLLCLFPVVMSFMLVTNGEGNAFRIGDNYYQAGIPCFFNSLTGYKCLTCGMTRCFIYMSDFNFVAAWNMNPAGVLLYMFCIIQIPYRLFLILRPKVNIHRLVVLFQYAFLVIIGVAAVIKFVAQFLINKV